MGDKAKDAIPALIEQIRTKEGEDAVRTLGALGPRAADAVPAIVRHLQLQTACSHYEISLETLGQIGPAATKAVPFLDEVLETADARTRVEIIGVLLRITKDEKTYLGMLKRIALNADDASASDDAFGAISCLAHENKSAREFLREALRSEDMRIRVIACGYVSRHGEGAIDALPEMLDILATEESPGGFSRYDHKEVLKYLELLGPKGASAVAVLKKFIGDDNDSENVEMAKAILARLEKR
jgi:hypothetical protein